MQFSIIVPVYNVENYLEKCLDSILNQSLGDWEVIVVDDGSTDGSGGICDTYAGKDSRIHVIHQKNMGLSAARNTGLDHASGEWIVFLDSDDWIEPQMLELLDFQIEKYPADLYSFNARKVDGQGEVTKRLLYVVENETVVFLKEEDRFSFFFDRFMQYQTSWEVCFRIFRRSLIEKAKLRFLPTQEVFAEDYLFTFQYLLYAEKIRLLCHIFYNYFQRDTSLLNTLELETVLPRLFRWGQYGYESVCRAGLVRFAKNYDRLYFMLLNFHIQHLLRDLPEETLHACLQSRESGKQHRRWLKKLKKSQSDLDKYMIKVGWL